MILTPCAHHPLRQPVLTSMVMGRDTSSSHRQSQPCPPSPPSLSSPGSWPPSQHHSHPSCPEDPGTGSKVWSRELNQRSGLYKGQIWDPILLSSLFLVRGMFSCFHIQLLRVNTGLTSQHSACTFMSTFALLTQLQAPWVLLSALSFRNVP